MSEELKPCPFCGGEAHIHEHYTFGGYVPKEYPNNEPLGYAIGCSKYDCRGKRENTGFLYDTEAQAIEAWNTRTPEQAIAATLGDKPPKKCSTCQYRYVVGQRPYPTFGYMCGFGNGKKLCGDNTSILDHMGCEHWEKELK